MPVVNDGLRHIAGLDPVPNRRPARPYDQNSFKFAVMPPLPEA